MQTDRPSSPPERAAVRTGPGRAGRDLRAAIGVGVGLGVVIVATLYTYRPAFVAVVATAAGVGLWELGGAMSTAGRRLPLVPMWVGTVAMLALGYARGPGALVIAFLLTVAAVLVWRLPTQAAGYLSDVASSALMTTYVPFLAGFAVLLVRPGDGAYRVTTFVATVVCSDVGGYAAGVLAGRHPMAPTVSPKKSWEGFAGSTLACVAGGVGLVAGLLGGAWWQGVVFGLAVVCSATVGDLGESMIKRDLGIKDMGSLLPGHGGLMDRLDSLLPTAPVAWLLLGHLVPPGH